MIIRESVIQDEPAIKEVSSLAIASLRKVYRPTKEAIARKANTAKQRTCLVCVYENKVVGVVEYEKAESMLHIIGLSVYPSHQRKGIAGLFINYLGQIARKLGASGLSLYTIKQTGNVEIFSKLGFQVIKESPAQWVKSVTGDDLIDVYMEKMVK
jgi:N-acetylglutamate synthase-like GNAT family acetyltransferase